MTKLIGVLGGTSWPSTMLLYRKLNERVQCRLGGHHSARILLYSIDYHTIKSRYNDGWDEIPALLRHEVEALLSHRPDCWLLANNTLHKAYDLIADELPGGIAFFHAVELVRRHLLDLRVSRILLLGTRFTMEDGFFAAPLRREGLHVEIPGLIDRKKIQHIQSRLAKGETEASFEDYFGQLLEMHRRSGCEAVITACTELPMVINQSLTKMLVIDPLDLQAQACVDFALA